MPSAPWTRRGPRGRDKTNGGARWARLVPASPNTRYRATAATVPGDLEECAMAGVADAEKHSIRMIADRLLVMPSKEAGERKSRSGILIPATADVSRRLVWAEVLAVGPTVRTIEPQDSV